MEVGGAISRFIPPFEASGGIFRALGLGLKMKEFSGFHRVLIWVRFSSVSKTTGLGGFRFF